MWFRSSTWLAGLVLSVLSVSSLAQTTVKPYTGRINLAVNDAFTYVLDKRGYPLSDPRAVTTKRNLEKRLSAVANATTVGTKVPWLKMASRLSTPLMLGQVAWELWDGYQWSEIETNDQGQNVVKVSTRAGGSNGEIQTFPGNSASLELPPGSYNFKSASTPYNVFTYRRVDIPCPESGYCSATGNAPAYYDQSMSAELTSSTLPADGRYWGRVSAVNRGEAPSRITAALYRWMAAEPQDLSQPQTQVLELEQAIIELENQMEVLEKQQEAIPDHVTASLVNQMWKEISATTGSLPWSSTYPVTARDIAESRSQYSKVQPKFEDFFTDPTTQNAVKIIPDSVGTIPEPTPGTGEGVNLGDDPNISAPELEATPTAQMIIDPILNAFDDLKNGSFEVGQGQCPVGEFHLFERDYLMDQHCLLLEQNRAQIGLAMMLVWSILSLLIVLRA